MANTVTLEELRGEHEVTLAASHRARRGKTLQAVLTIDEGYSLMFRLTFRDDQQVTVAPVAGLAEALRRYNHFDVA